MFINSAIILNILYETIVIYYSIFTLNSKPALVVYLMSVAHVLNTALKKHLLYEKYAYTPSLISVIEHS